MQLPQSYDTLPNFGQFEIKSLQVFSSVFSDSEATNLGFLAALDHQVGSSLSG